MCYVVCLRLCLFAVVVLCVVLFRLFCCCCYVVSLFLLGVLEFPLLLFVFCYVMCVIDYVCYCCLGEGGCFLL